MTFTVLFSFNRAVGKMRDLSEPWFPEKWETRMAPASWAVRGPSASVSQVLTTLLGLWRKTKLIITIIISDCN